MRKLRSWFAETVEGYAAVLRSPNLRRSQIAWAGAVTAEWAFFVGVSVFAFHHSGTLGVGLVGLIRMLPSAVVAPVAGLFGDRYRRDRVVLGVFVAMGAVAATAALVAFFSPPLALIYALAGVHGAATTLSRSAQWSLLPSLCGTPDELVAANSSTLSTENAGTLAGPAISAIILTSAGPGTLFAVCAATYLLSAVAVARIRLVEKPERPARKVGYMEELLAGFPTLFRDRDTTLVVGLFWAQGLVRGALNVFLVVVALELLHTGDSGVGFLTAALGVGGLVGAVASVSLSGRRLAAPFAGGLVFWGLPLMAMAGWQETGAALFLMAVVGAANSVEDVAGMTLLQRLLPNELLSRALGVFWGFAMGTVGLGSIAAAGLIDGFGIRATLIATGAVLPLLILLSWHRLSAIDRKVAAPAAQLDAIAMVPMLAPLSLAAKDQLAAALVPLAPAAGTEIIREGDVGDRFYLVVEGDADVFHQGRQVSTRGAGDYFGEIALLRDVPRTATVVARGAMRLYALERDDFLAAVTQHAAGREAGEAVVRERLAVTA